MESSEKIKTRVPNSYTSSLKGDEIASKYRANVVLNILQSKEIGSDASIVDVGCGYGVLLEKLRDSKFNDFLGVEPIEEVVESLQSRGIEAILGDLEKGVDKIDDKSVDVVTCLEVLEHLYDPRSALNEINRWLQPGGILIVSVPNAYRLKQRLNMLAGKPTSDVTLVGGHIKFFDWNTIKNMVERANFRVESEFGEGGLRMREIIPGYMSILRTFPRLLTKWIFIIAKKTDGDK